MKRYIYCLCAVFCMFLNGYCAGGDWRVYASYHNAERVVEMGGIIYVTSNGGLFSYNPEDMGVETYDKSNVLNDNGIYDVAVCGATNEIVIVYDNCNIDIMDSNGDVYNIPDLKIKALDDKTINDMVIDGQTLYLSLNSGVVCLDVKKRGFGNYYNLGHAVMSVAVDKGIIYAATKNGVYNGSMSKNLLDVSNWTLMNGTVLNKVVNLNGSIYALTSGGLYSVDKKTFATNRISTVKFTGWSICNDVVYFTGANSLASVDATGKFVSYGKSNVKALAYRGGNFWVACGSEGLKAMKIEGTSMEETVSSVIPESPVRNYSYNLRMTPEGRLLVAGGAFNYPAVNREGTIMKYENNEWTAFDEQKPVELVTRNYYMNTTDVAQNPNDSEHHFVGAARSGLYEFRNYELVNHYTYNNSPLTSILPNDKNPGYYVRVTGVDYDWDGNLWMCNNECDTIVRILTKEGKWLAFYYDEIKGFPTFDHYLFDSRGIVWLNSRRTTSAGHNAGVLAIYTNGTLEDRSDDSHRFIYRFTNQDGKAYQPTLYNCMVEDLDGAIWIGTDAGPFVSYNPGKVFSPDFYFTQVKVPRNDGTNLADYLLSDVPVKCIAIDGGNRKWIGTTGNGVYLISADGTETVEHFTTENSPLLSDAIYSIAIDGSTGEVFIATDKGLVSYMGDATDPVSEFDEDVVKAYPNPVRPEYQGKVSITGLMYNSNVKIVNAAGRLVNEGTSVGGEYTWDCTTTSGKRVGSGVYYVLATDEEGEKGVATKILIVK